MSFSTLSAIKNFIFNKDISKEMFVCIFSVFFALAFPFMANASVKSSLYRLLGDEVSAKVPDNTVDKNLQNMSVLKATLNNDPKVAMTLLEPAVVSQNALMAEIGPSGTSADIEKPINTQISIYVVRNGDTLSSIAELFDVSVNTITWANNLKKGEKLKEGQNLVILPISGVNHTVKKGESIKSIVSNYKADLNEVLLYNDITVSSKLIPGDTIIIPDGESVPVIKVATKSGSSKNTLHDANGPVYPGYYKRPIVGGKRSQGLHGFNAVDLAAPVGTPIYASAKGKVIASVSNGAWNGGYGNFIIISHANGTQTLYSHNSKNIVSIGQNVEQGEVIAKVGATGHATGPHVHFEIRGASNPF